MAQWMYMLAIQFIASAELRAQPCRAHWNTLPPISGVDYSSYSSVAARAALLDITAGGAVLHRIVEVDPIGDLTKEEQAYLLLERVATSEVSDEELMSLHLLATELDRGSVPYRGWR